MALNAFRIINAPGKHVVEMISRHLPADVRKRLDEIVYDSIALISAPVPNIYYYADVAMKAGDVFASELLGNCPQHTTTLVLFGNIASVKAAIGAIEAEKEKK